ncbi:hypothetical protein AKJ42_02245 [candidate division MSBL1 archaeon SCGC-AAA261C02]|nr:hypothetical protein AKJ42_02245 [candidate division MSBL1 archaeon SCGC-AAA261C02]KXB09214.1 hypothetical protein AKJ46_00755 [candidate division MSBL1 archaeon SCGC-AAA833K04]
MFGSNSHLADTDGDGLQDDADRDPLTSINLEVLESAPTELDSENIRNAVDIWPKLFENTTQTIYLETYYVADSVPSKIYNALKGAGERGVKVKILLDKEMYEDDPSQADYLNSLKNIEVRTLNVGELSGGWLHSKYFVIDGRVAFVGSQNWSWTALEDGREIGALVRSKAFGEALVSIFEADWVKSGGSPLTPQRSNDTDGDSWPDDYERWVSTSRTNPDTDNDGIPNSRDSNPFVPLDTSVAGASVEWFYPVETAPTGDLDNPYIRDTENVLCELINSASENIRAQLYQYSTAGNYTMLDNALRKAANRGVEVKVLVDNKSHLNTDYPHPEVLDNLAIVPGISVKIIDIEAIGEWPGGGWVHTKVLSVDGERAYVGSANWFAPHMSHEITLGGWHAGPTRDVGIVFKSPETVRILENIFTQDWNSEYAGAL